MMMMAIVADFMQSPLVTWVKSFNESDDLVSFHDLCDGVFLNDVMLQIDQREAELACGVNRIDKDSNARMQNWAFLLANINSYYQDILQQLLVMPCPDIVMLTKQPAKEESITSLQMILLQLLGCAVQCPRKEVYIDVITKFDSNVQEAIVEHIKEITCNEEYVVSIDQNPADINFYTILTNLVAERDSCTQTIMKLSQERDYFEHEVIGDTATPMTPPICLEKHHLQKELATYKKNLRNLSEELEDRSGLIQELKSELKQAKSNLSSMKAQNTALIKDADVEKSYKDEVLLLRDEVAKLTSYEVDVRKYKNKINDVEQKLHQVEELNATNAVTIAEMKTLQEKVDLSKNQISCLVDELQQAHSQAEKLHLERKAALGHIEDLEERNAVLELECNKLSEGNVGGGYNIQKLLSCSTTDMFSSTQLHTNGNSISDELGTSLSSETTKLRTENSELRSSLAEMTEKLSCAHAELDTARACVTRELEEGFTQRLESARRESAQLVVHEACAHASELAGLRRELTSAEWRARLAEEESARECEHAMRVQHENAELVGERDRLKERIAALQRESARHVARLEHEVSTLQKSAGALRAHSDRICRLCETTPASHKVSNERRSTSRLSFVSADECTDNRQNSEADKISVTSASAQNKGGFSFFRRDAKLRHSMSSVDRPDVTRSFSKTNIADRLRLFGSRSGSSRKLSTSDRDSGCATSPDSSTCNTRDSDKMKRRVVTNGNSPPKGGGDKWRVFVDKIVELQNKNQRLLAENADIAKALSARGAAMERCSELDVKNMQLEAENHKLRNICDALQHALSIANPYDKREYHYLSNV